MVSNNVLALLVMVSIVLSIGSLYMNFGFFAVPSSDSSSITGQVAGTTSATVSASAAISLPVSTVGFGSVANNELKNTTQTFNPGPFLLQNDGTVDVNVTVYATNLWVGTGAQNPSTFFRVNSTVNETSAVPAASDLLAITNMPNATIVGGGVAPAGIATRLNYTDAKDAVNAHIFITVPNDESAGAKSSTVTFTATQA